MKNYKKFSETPLIEVRKFSPNLVQDICMTNLKCIRKQFRIILISAKKF